MGRKAENQLHGIVSEKQLCEFFNITRMTAYNWRKKGMPFIKGDNDSIRAGIRYNAKEVMAWTRKKIVKGKIRTWYGEDEDEDS